MPNDILHPQTVPELHRQSHQITYQSHQISYQSHQISYQSHQISYKYDLKYCFVIFLIIWPQVMNSHP